MSPSLIGLDPLLAEAWMPLAEGSHPNHAGKFAETAQLALEDDELEEMSAIYAADAISDNHEDGINNRKFYKAATHSPLANEWDTARRE